MPFSKLEVDHNLRDLTISLYNIGVFPPFNKRNEINFKRRSHRETSKRNEKTKKIAETYIAVLATFITLNKLQL